MGQTFLPVIWFSSCEKSLHQSFITNHRQNSTRNHKLDIHFSFVSDTKITVFAASWDATSDKMPSLICSSPLCFSNALGGFVGFSRYTAYFYIRIYVLYVTWTTCFGLSYFRPSSGPSIQQSDRLTWRWPKIRQAETCRPRDIQEIYTYIKIGCVLTETYKTP